MAKAKILICDDDQGIRESLGFILRDNYEIAFANDGLQALEHIKREHTDLILLDLKMPGLDGFQVLKELEKIKSRVKVIVITGYSSSATANRAIKSGACDYIIKPFDKDELLEAVAKVLK